MKNMKNMKKLAIIATLALAAASASAFEVGVVGGSNYGLDRNYGGVTIGQNFGKFGLEAGFERGTDGYQNQNTWTGTGSYSLGKAYGAGFALKAGVAYITPEYTKNGWAGRVGGGVSFPLTPQFTIGADYMYQFAQAAITQQSGNMLSLNAKFKF